MSFFIEITRPAPSDEAPDQDIVCYVGTFDGEVSFFPGTQRFSMADYQRHWRSRLSSILRGTKVEYMWMNAPSDPADVFGAALVLYADVDGAVKVRDQLVFPGLASAESPELDQLEYDPPEYEEFTEEGDRISTWHTSLEDIATYLRTTERQNDYADI